MLISCFRASGGSWPITFKKFFLLTFLLFVKLRYL